jgi:uncharacterized membrane protein
MSDVPPPQFANYPRPGYQGSPYGRPPGVYIDAISDAWTMVRQDLASWVGATIISGLVIVPLYVVSVYLQLNYGPPAITHTPDVTDLGTILQGQAASTVFSLPLTIMIYILQAGMMHMGVAQASGEALSPGMVLAGFRRFGSLVGANFLYLLLVYIGLALCLVPGIYLMGALAFTSLMVIEQEVGPVEAIKRSFTVLKSHAWMMFLLLFVAGIVLGLGAFACLVGLLVTIPIYSAAIGLTYTYFFPRMPAAAPVAYAPPPASG